MNIRKLFKKTMICLTSAFIVGSTCLSGVSAATYTTGSVHHDDWILTKPDGSTHGHEGQLQVNGVDAYCVDYETTFHKNKTVVAGTYKDIGLTAEKAKRLAVIAYYGHKVSGRTGTDWYAITQGLLWREIEGRTDLEFVSCKTAPTYADQQRCWNAILADVDRYYTAPSFAKNTYTVDADGSITLTDTNNVLSDMVIANDGGLDVSISGNKLTIKGKSGVIGKINLVLKKNIPVAETGTTIVYTADDCQAVAQFKISDPFQASLSVEIQEYGNLELTKYNEDKSGLVPNTEYRITGDGYDQTFTTDANGKISIERLKVGTYTITEVKASEGYLINTGSMTVTVEANKTAKAEFTNNEPTGKVTFTKSIDLNQTNNLKGDANVEGVTYQLVADEKITNKAGTKTFFNKGDVVESKKTDANGKITWDDLPLGHYVIKETKTNGTLVLNEETYKVSIEYEGQTVAKVSRMAEGSDRVNMQKIQIFKSGTKDGISDLVKGLQGAEFTFKLKSEVDHVGWDSAPAYAIVVTDKNGKANTSYLPYGTYLVRETKTPADYITAPDFTVSVTKDYTEFDDVEQVKRINVNNRPFTSQLKLVKKDKETGKTVTLNSASFRIKDANGNYVTQKVSGKKYDTFTTNSKNQVVVFDGNNGEVFLPLSLDAGTYSVEEVKVPEGFLELESPVTFTITNTRNYDVDGDEDPIVTVQVKNDRCYGKLEVKKSIESFDADKILVNKEDLSGFEFTLFAKEDIVSPIDGSVLLKANEKYGTYLTDKEGKISVSKIPMGSYILKETKTKDGFVLDDKETAITFKQADTVTKEYKVTTDIENKTTKFEFSKKSVTGDDELEGAKLTVADKDGNIIDEWTSGKETHMIEGLTVNQVYTLTEEIAPDGYVKATTIYFTVENDGNVQKITMIDKTVSMSKVDVGGKEVEGATIQVKDKDGNIVDEWVSTTESHLIKGLEEGQTYILHEEVATDGYVKATDVEFTVSKEKTDDKVTMIDKIVDMSKVDVTGEEVPGAKIQVFDEDCNIVDEWISTDEPHKIKGLEEGKKYILHEEVGPEGYVVATDIEFTVTEEKENQHLELTDKQLFVKKMDQLDKYVEGAKLQVLDKEGNVIAEWDTKEEYAVSGLKAGETYILHEVEAPENYIKAEDIEFTVKDDKENQYVEMIDIKTDDVDITKYDATSKKELPGAHLEIRDKDGKLIEEWISTEEQHKVRLVVGETYTLTETIAPDGYKVAETIEFTVEDNGKVVQQVQMFDELLPARQIVNTGDNSNIMIYVLLASGSAVALLGTYYFERKKEEE